MYDNNVLLVLKAPEKTEKIERRKKTIIVIMWDNNVPWVWEAPTPTKEETLTLPTTTHCSDPVYKYKPTNTKVIQLRIQKHK